MLYIFRGHKTLLLKTYYSREMELPAQELWWHFNPDTGNFNHSPWPKHQTQLVHQQAHCWRKSCSKCPTRSSTRMMTSLDGNIFRVTGHLCGEFIGHRWIPHKGQWRGALMFSLICARINGWVNNREAGDLRRHQDSGVLKKQKSIEILCVPCFHYRKYYRACHHLSAYTFSIDGKD